MTTQTQEAAMTRVDQGIVARTILGAPEGRGVRSQDRLIGKLNPQEAKILAAARQKIDENDPAGALRVIAREAPATTQTELATKVLKLANPALIATLGARPPADIITVAEARPVLAIHKYLDRGIDSLNPNERKELMNTVKVALGDSVPYLQDLFKRTGVNEKEVDQLLVPLLQQDTFRAKLHEKYKDLVTKMDTLATEKVAREKKINEAAQKLTALKVKEAIRTGTAPAAGEELRIYNAHLAVVEDPMKPDPRGGGLPTIQRSQALHILDVEINNLQDSMKKRNTKILAAQGKVAAAAALVPPSPHLPAYRAQLAALQTNQSTDLLSVTTHVAAKSGYESSIKTAKDTWDALNTQFGFDALPLDQAGISGLTAEIKSEIQLLTSADKPEWDIMIESAKEAIATAASAGFQESITQNKKYVDVAKVDVGDKRKANAVEGALLLEKAWRNNKNTKINMKKAKKLVEDYISTDPRNVNPEKFMEAIIKKDKRMTYPALEEMRTADPEGYKKLAGEFMTDFVQDYIQGGGRFEEEVELSLYSSEVGKTLIDTALSNLGMSEADRAKLRYKERSALGKFIRSPKTWLTLGLLATGGYMAFGSTAAASVMAALTSANPTTFAAFQTTIAPMSLGEKAIASVQAAAYMGAQFVGNVVEAAKGFVVPSEQMTHWADDVITTIYTPNSTNIESLGVQNSDVVKWVVGGAALTGATLIANGKYGQRAAAEETRGAVKNSSPTPNVVTEARHE